MSDDRLLLVARPYDLSDAPFDGFVTHHARLVELLRSRYQLRLLLVRPEHDRSYVRADLRDLVYADLAAPALGLSRRERLRRGLALTRGAPLGAASLRISEVARACGASRAVTLGPWLGQEYEAIYRVLPTMHFFEEDLSAMPENAPQSVQARMLRRLECAFQRHARFQPRCAVYIGPGEEGPARRRYAQSRLLWHPYLLPREDWPLAQNASQGKHVLVVGQFAQPRNAEGLEHVLDALVRIPQRPLVKLLSSAGTHPCLQKHLDSGALVRDSDSGLLYDKYRSAIASIVPARRVSGIKTTVLQAWAAGCPVACFPVSASSVGTFAFDSVVQASTPALLAERLVAMINNHDQREKLAARGRRVMEEYFDPSVRAQELLAALDGLI